MRREPFRVFFPLGILLAWAGVLPWMLFGTGLIRPWPGTYHALTMTQAFLLAIAVGFLTTMLPRRTGASPLSYWELMPLALGLPVIPIAIALGHLAWGEIAYLLVVSVCVQFAVRRFRARTSPQPLPPSFFFIPLSFLMGFAGASLLLAFSLGADAWTLAMGRSLVEEGVLLGMVLAVAPMLSPLILHGEVPSFGSPTEMRRSRALHALFAILLVTSFVLEHGVSARIGLVLRGGVLAFELIWFGRLLDSPEKDGAHRRLYRLGLLFVPLGPLTAALMPALRIPLLHLTFIGGFSLLVFSVSFHVALLHTGRELAATRSSPNTLVIGALTLLAMTVRVFAERFSNHYFEALTIAASLWISAAVLWGLKLVVLITRPATRTEPVARGKPS